ncbi:helix-turn-helix domain-containing protein [Mariniphaga sp.]|uniref:helix-turn-helix domain-containing protein n=1 Tax=Mariniphaga sp. TaxID=1954475 RepID=UPI0035696E3C
MENDFIHRMTETVDANLHNEHFGPEELAAQMGMSHSALHRKVKNVCNKTISRFIRERRLEKSKELLQNENYSVSEIAYKVGFGSATYFNKCFHEYFGVAPGEFKKGEEAKSGEIPMSNKKISKVLFFIGGSVLILVFAYLYLNGTFSTLKNESPVEKSIAVRPFNYLAANTDKSYLANAMMMEIINQLSQIKGLRVMSSTSVLPYLNQTDKVIGKKINCSFILNGNLYVEDGKMNLILTLVDADNENVIKSFNYKNELNNIIELPGIIAQSVARELNAELTEQEKLRVGKIPSLNLTAYDFYSRGNEEFINFQIYNDKEYIEAASNYFKKAIAVDSLFAKAYVGLASVYWENYYWKNYFEAYFIDSVKIILEKAISIDNQINEAHTLLGYYYLFYDDGKNAQKEFEMALQLNPNDWKAYLGLGDLYRLSDLVLSVKNYHEATRLNRGKEYSIILRKLIGVFSSAGMVDYAKKLMNQKLMLDNDSVSYYVYLTSNLFYSGDFDKSIYYALKGISIDPENETLLIFLGCSYSFMEEYEKSLEYFELALRDGLGIMLLNTSHRIGYSYWKAGQKEMGLEFMYVQQKYSKESAQKNRPYAINRASFYDEAALHAFFGEKEKALENLEKFCEAEVITFAISQLIKMDPLFNSIREDSEFKKIEAEIINKYLKEHERVKKWLDEQNIL